MSVIIRAAKPDDMKNHEQKPMNYGVQREKMHNNTQARARSA